MTLPQGLIKVWIDGQIVDGKDAQLSIFDRGFLYGDSIYEVLRTFSGKPFGLEEHLQRLESSAAGLRLPLPPRDRIRQAILQTCAAANTPDAYIRIIVTRGSGEMGLDTGLADETRLVVIVRPVQLPPTSAYSEGVAVAIVGHSRSAPGAVDPQIKSGNYLASILALAEAKSRGAFEALLCDGVGRVSEGSTSNFFIVRRGRLVTPPVSVGILEGITRRKVIELARAERMAVDEQPLWPTDLKRADEMLLSSSVRGLLPIVRVDDTVIGGGKPGPVVRRIMALYDALTRA